MIIEETLKSLASKAPPNKIHKPYTLPNPLPHERNCNTHTPVFIQTFGLTNTRSFSFKLLDWHTQARFNSNFPSDKHTRLPFKPSVRCTHTLIFIQTFRPTHAHTHPCSFKLSVGRTHTHGHVHSNFLSTHLWSFKLSVWRTHACFLRLTHDESLTWAQYSIDLPDSLHTNEVTDILRWYPVLGFLTWLPMRKQLLVCPHLLRLVLVHKLLLLSVRQLAPHLPNDLADLPQLQVGVARLHRVPHLEY